MSSVSRRQRLLLLFMTAAPASAASRCGGCDCFAECDGFLLQEEFEGDKVAAGGAALNNKDIFFEPVAAAVGDCGSFALLPTSKLRRLRPNMVVLVVLVLC